MAESNGAVKLGKPNRGKVKFEFEDGDVFEVDAIEVYDRWWGVNWELRDKDGFLVAKDFAKHSENRRQLVQGIIEEAYRSLQKPAPQVDRAAAELFIAEVEKKVEELRGFTSRRSEKPSSSPTSSEPQGEAKEVFSQ